MIVSNCMNRLIILLSLACTSLLVASSKAELEQGEERQRCKTMREL